MIKQIKHIALTICGSALALLACVTTAYADANTHHKNVEQRLSDLTGTYYLQGVMEVGSAFRLQPSGEFQYMLTYGAVDKEANGTWQKTATGVTLTSQSKPSIEKTKVNASRAWDEQAEKKWRQALYDAKQEKVNKRCDILYPPAGTIPLGMLEPNKPINNLAELKAFDADITRMDNTYAAMLKKLHTLQQKTLATTDKTQKKKLAEHAKKRLLEKIALNRKLYQAYTDYNLALERMLQSTLGHAEQFQWRDVDAIPRYQKPAVCVNNLSTQVPENPKEWQGGKKGNVVAVIVYSGEAYDKYRTISRVPLRFVFSDGSEKNVFLSGSYAVSKKPEGTELKQVVLLGLEDHQKGTADTTVNITNDQPVQEIRMALTPLQAFDELRLKQLDEDTLSPTHGNLKGKKYVRQ